jgi:hypothetical protein
MNNIAVYQLGIGSTCERRVATLLEDNMFVYKGHWSMDRDKVCLNLRIYIDLSLDYNTRRHGLSRAALLFSTLRSLIPSRPRGSAQTEPLETNTSTCTRRHFLIIRTKKSLRFHWLRWLQPAYVFYMLCVELAPNPTNHRFTPCSVTGGPGFPKRGFNNFGVNLSQQPTRRSPRLWRTSRSRNRPNFILL